MSETDDLPPNPLFPLGPPPRGGCRPECCPGFQGDLEAYADGDLPEEGNAWRVRRHLQDCAACRAYLEEHHALTRAILSGAFPAGGMDEGSAGAQREHGRRVHLIMDRIHAEVAPRAAERGAVGSEPSLTPGSGLPARARRRISSTTARAWLSAAAAILLGVVLSRMAFPPWEEVDFDAVAVGSWAGSEPGGGLSQWAGEARGASGRASGDSLSGEVATPELRWVVDSGRTGRGTARGFPAGDFRLLGFRPSVGGLVAREPSRKLEWVVHAGVRSRALLDSESRYFLVSEEIEGAGGRGRAGSLSAAPVAPTEIVPVTWYAASEPDAVPAPLPGERAYRVYVLRGLSVPFVSEESEEDPFLFLEPRPRGFGAWTLPASFEH